MPSHDLSGARRVHAVLAAALDDPTALDRLRRQSGKAGSIAAALDLDRVRLFAGLAVKVRHNDVRLSLPLTFKMLDLLKISIEFFSSYTKHAAALRRAGKKSRDDKIQSIVEYLDRWLDPTIPAHRLAWDLARHEHAQIRLRASAANLAADRGEIEWVAVTPKSVPRRADPLILHEMTCNPFELERQLGSPCCDLSTIRRGQFHYAYRWDVRHGGVSTLAVDELGRVLMDLANGRRSIARMVANLCRAGIAVDAEALCAAVGDLAGHGVLTLRA